ncbi:tetratricopeptide repeat protein [Dysgonomonas macrotermitis]|uniref:Tetratricopeptide repeat-containing protein n=1 Tax=Dysgonomonas macrotermitis TaxID=1346286 RepID=A0A1M5E008_9BACT|nr:tetratricopeptide repeat protein [Dysgonomonas macrotermitis]SHF72535.1 Tetratricopeptide repeat-containing protein [Dysgonomonas macrotermitis]
MSNNILSQKKEILEYLSKRQLKNAIELLHKLVVNAQDWHISEKLSELETNYKYMLHYQFEGLEDSQKGTIYSNILRSLYEITDDSSDELLAIDSSNIFYERLRIQAARPATIFNDFTRQLKEISTSLSVLDLLNYDDSTATQKRDLAIRRERIGSDLFNYVFTSPRSAESDQQEYLDFISNDDIPIRERALFISALTLSLFHRFDFRKTIVLIDACKSHHMAIRQRAIVGLIIVLQMYDVRWPLYPECQFRLDALSEDEGFRKSVLSVVKQLIRSRETEEISRKLTEEIIPEMMKFNSLAGKKLNMEDLMGETDFADKNPDWKKELENSGLANKLQEYSSLQMEGADVFHSTFANLKNFTFFREMSNWFLAFDTSYSELQSIFSGKDGLNGFLQTAVLNSGHMCNSDKYSFALSLLQIPSAQREIMAQRFSQESEQLKELQKEAEALHPTISEEVISNQYIQDLYRFFKLYPYKNNFLDIFTLRLNFYDKESIAPLIADKENMLQIANFCFDKNFFADALAIYEKLIKENITNSDIWQKIGYCKQIQNNLQGALDAYLQAETFSPDNSWIIKRIAQTYRSLKDPQHSLEYYQRAAQLNPNNLNLELNIGHCYLELGQYEQALNCYFKIEVLETKTNKAWRPIAWTAFLLRKLDVAEKYYERILADKPNAHDYLNAGHVQLCLNNKKAALDYYLNAAVKISDFDQFIKLFEEDKTELISAGIENSFFPLLFDEIRYKLD